MDVAAHKKRLMIMLAVVGVALIVALVSIYLSFLTHALWAKALFGLALASGFGAQIWLIWSWKKAEGRQTGGKA